MPIDSRRDAPGPQPGSVTAAASQAAAANTGRMELADAVLVARTKQGDVGAFGELVQRHQRAVCAVVSKMLDDRDDVDDIVQEVFVQAYKSISSFKEQAAFTTWIYRITVNTTIKQMKKSKLRQATSIDDPAVGLQETLVSLNGDGPETTAEKRERSEAIRRAIRSLSDHHKAVVVLHYFQGCSCEEIARVLDCSVGTVWSRLHYACRKLQGQLTWLVTEGE